MSVPVFIVSNLTINVLLRVGAKYYFCVHEPIILFVNYLVRYLKVLTLMGSPSLGIASKFN